MGENSKIEWCDHTFNPWIGCQEMSPACDCCYARVMNDHGEIQLRNLPTTQRIGGCRSTVAIVGAIRESKGHGR